MSAKRKKRVPKTGAVWRMSADEATLASKPHYNGYACGHGAHGDAKFDRAKSKRAWKRQMMQEGARKGSFLFASKRFYRNAVILLLRAPIARPGDHLAPKFSMAPSIAGGSNTIPGICRLRSNHGENALRQLNYQAAQLLLPNKIATGT